MPDFNLDDWQTDPTTKIQNPGGRAILAGRQG